MKEQEKGSGYENEAVRRKIQMLGSNGQITNVCRRVRGLNVAVVVAEEEWRQAAK